MVKISLQPPRFKYEYRRGIKKEKPKVGTELSLILGVFLLVLLINTTIVFSFNPATNGQASQKIPDTAIGSPSSGSVLPDSVLASGSPIIDPFANPVTSSLAPVAVLPGTNLPLLNLSDPVETQVFDTTIAGTTEGTVEGSMPVALSSEYITYGTPKPVIREQHEYLQTEFPRISMEGYIPLYTLSSHDLSNALLPVYFNLVNPPLIVDYDISPFIVTDEKFVEYKTGSTKHAEILKTTYPFEQTWAHVTVRNKDTGQIVAEDGYGRTYGLQSPRQLVLRQSGNYEFEFDGEFAILNLTMKAKRDGNIP